ncbi:MAG: hypothetical protein ACLPSH_04785 [Vulcanimicrobiaceae bacterium]|jgi:hypothetical protein
MLHTLAFIGTIVALNTTTSGSIGVSMTVPVMCQDYRVGDKIVAHCNNEQPSTTPIAGVALGRPYLSGGAHVSDTAEQAAAIAPAAAVINNASLCLRCSFH